jgi:Protein of unknown function (DUF3619)
MNTPQDHRLDQNLSDEKLAEKIAALLDQGTREITAPTAAKLLAARKEALAHFQEKPAHAWAPRWANSGLLGRMAEPFSHNLRAGFVVMALVASLLVMVAWQSMGQQSSEIAEVDEGLLTDELPINAYLDKGFESWLKRPSN